MKRFVPANRVAVAILIFFYSGRLAAQAVANATIHGEITDATGAFVPNAQVKAIQTDTGQTVNTVTDSTGSYVLPNLPVGPYRLEVGAPAFSTYVRSGIILQVGNNVQLNVALQVGTVNQEMRVSANAAMVETQDTSVSEVIDQRRITDLPLNGRQATDLILLSGGASVPPGAAGRFITTHDYVSSVGVSIAGGQENGNNYLLDGADHNDTHSNVNLPFPFPDALQEFSVQTNGVSARYGLHPFAVVNAITRSGTNQIHGSLFEFVFAELLEPIRKRKMKLYARILEPFSAEMAGLLPNWVKVLTIDAYGRPGRLPCFNNPDYRNFWLATSEDMFRTYELDGFQFGAERSGPLSGLVLNGAPPYCFCPHCRARPGEGH